MCINNMCHDISSAPLELVMVNFPDVMAGYYDDYPSRLRMFAALQEDLNNKTLEKLPDLPTVKKGANIVEDPYLLLYYMDFSHMQQKDLRQQDHQNIYFR